MLNGFFTFKIQHLTFNIPPIRSGAVAQLGEHLLCKQGVVGSIPISSTRRVRASQLSRNGSCFHRVIVHPRRRSRPRESAVSAVERRSSASIFAIGSSLTIEYGL